MGNNLSGSGKQRQFPANIFVNTDRPGYYAGEFVTGRVYLVVHQPTNCRGVFLSLKGEERAWAHRIHRKSEKRGEHTHHYKEYENYKRRKLIFEANQLILQMAPNITMLQPGQYEIPFQVHLPQNLPGSFFEERRIGGEYPANKDYYSEIVYYFKAYVDEGRKLKVPDQIASKAYLKVGTQNPGNYEPVLAEQLQGMYFCCCFKQGDVYMKTYPEEAVYKAGDRIKLNLEVANRSKQNIKKIDVRLIRKLKMRLFRISRSRQHHRVPMNPFNKEELTENFKEPKSWFGTELSPHTEEFTETMCETFFEGLAPGQEAMGNNARALYLDLFSNDGSKNFSTETQGEVLSCEYFIQVMADAENCCVTDVPLNIQTHIIPDINTGLEAVQYAVAVPIQPENWSPLVQPAIEIPDANIKYM